jgi:hypothetical protein
MHGKGDLIADTALGPFRSPFRPRPIPNQSRPEGGCAFPLIRPSVATGVRATQRSRDGLANGFSVRSTTDRRDTASGDAMLFDAIATVILVGMMFIPLVNIVVGLIFGAGLGGVVGAFVGLSLAILIIAAEKLIGDRLGWFEGARETIGEPDVRPQARPRLRLTRRRALVMRSNQPRDYTRAPIYFREPSTLAPWKPRPLALPITPSRQIAAEPSAMGSAFRRHLERAELTSFAD